MYMDPEKSHEWLQLNCYRQSLRKGCNKEGKEHSDHQMLYLALCEAGVLLAVDLLVLEEETLGLAGTLKVVVGCAPACTTPHGRTHLTTHITTLEGKRTAWFKKACVHYDQK